MSDFFKRRTTIASRREEVKALEPPTFTICLDPPFKASEYSAYKLNYPNEISWYDFPNETLGQRFDKVSFQLGTDFHISYIIQLNGEPITWWPHRPLKNDEYFAIHPIQTYRHGTCTKIQPRFTIISEPFSLWLYLNLDLSLESIDEPSKFIIYMTSNNTWQSVGDLSFGRSTPSKVELDLKTYTSYVAQTIEYVFDKGLESSEDCWKSHLKNSNCTTLCQYFSVGNLPMCNTSQEVHCIRNVALKQNLYKICNEKKNFLNFNGDLTKVSQYNPPGNDTIFEFFIPSLTKEIKEEIDIITLSDLIGSVGGSLGMFFGFSMSASAFYFMEKCIMKIEST